MINVAFVRGQFPSSILAFPAIPLPNAFGRKLRAAPRHLIVPGKYKYGRNPDSTADGSHRVIFFADRQSEPFHPTDWTHIASVLNIESRGVAICHHAKGLCRRFHIDRLPISVQNENRRFVQNVIHISRADCQSPEQEPRNYCLTTEELSSAGFRFGEVQGNSGKFGEGRGSFREGQGS